VSQEREEDPDAPRRYRLLRVGGVRRGEKAEGDAADKRSAAHYSIT
jgi:hypothetical protein